MAQVIQKILGNGNRPMKYSVVQCSELCSELHYVGSAVELHPPLALAHATQPTHIIDPYQNASEHDKGLQGFQK